MNRSFHRIAVLAAVLPGALLGVGGTAHAEDPTCVGTSSVGFVCDPQVTTGVPVDVETYTHTETVCVGVTCRDVDVTLVRVVEGDELEACVTWTNRDGTPGGRVCLFSSDPEPDPEPDPGPDPVECSVLQQFAGNYGLVFVNSQGDVYVDGEPFWDCPPYDTVWS